MENKKPLEKGDHFELIKDGDSYTLKNKGGLFNIKKDEWDSKILKVSAYKINRIELNSLDFSLVKRFLEFIKSRFNDVEYMTFKTEATNFNLINTLQKNGFNLVGMPIKLNINLVDVKELKSDENIRPSKDEDLNSLSTMTKDTFLHAYRYNDKNLDKNKVDDLYSNWIKSSCNGRSDVVLVYCVNKIPSGFIACNINGDLGIIDLIAVAKEARGKGIGQRLVLSSLEWFRKKGLNKVEVSTEAINYPSLKTYQKCGFKIDWIGVNLNYWFRK